MVVFFALFLLIAYNLINVITEQSSSFYKDIRFWLILISLIVLVWFTFQSYTI